jgi:hypothetical protein
MRIGCTLPTFRDDPAPAVELARAAEEAGLDGVFAFDHVWPMRQPGRPSLLGKLVLAAAAAVTRRIDVGTLVARVGLVPDVTLRSELAALDAVSGGRLVAGLGTGDSKSDDEQRAYGVALVPAARRRDSLRRLAEELREAGVEVWVGRGSPATDAVARRCGAVLNLWDAAPEAVAAAARVGPTSWGGPLPQDPAEAGVRLRRLAEAGATYAVWAWPASVDLVLEAIAASGVDRS